jgi:hypothetical protein
MIQVKTRLPHDSLSRPLGAVMHNEFIHIAQHSRACWKQLVCFEALTADFGKSFRPLVLIFCLYCVGGNLHIWRFGAHQGTWEQ